MPRFLTLEQAPDELAISKAQLYALLRRGELRALKIGGRGIWRVGADDLEDFIARAQEDTARWIAEDPFIGDDAQEEAPDDAAPTADPGFVNSPSNLIKLEGDRPPPPPE